MTKNWFKFVASTKLLEIMNTNNKSIINPKKFIAKSVIIKDLEVLSLQKEVLLLTKEHYLHTFNELFCDLEKIKIEKSKSVNSKYKSYNNALQIDNALDSLEKHITLYEHTKNVIKCAITCTSDKPDVIKAIVILLSLVHDFGKSKIIITDVIKNNSDIYTNTRHDIISSYYLKKVLLKNKEYDNLEIDHISFLCHALKNQHSENSIDNEILELFYKADALARDYELSTINSEYL